jgi:streptogramin lyase
MKSTSEMGREQRSRLSVVIASCAIAALMVACSPGGEAQDPWEVAELSLPSGTRYATYDADSDSIWLLTWLTPAQPKAQLTRFEISSGESETYDIPGDAERLGVGAGLEVYDSGAVWAVWGNRLIRLDAISRSVEEWAIPVLDPSFIDPQDPGLDGFAVDVAIDRSTRVWVAVHSAKAVQRLDPSTGSWETVSTEPLIAISTSDLTIAEDGSVLLNGAVREGASFGARLARIDPVAKSTALTDARALTYAVSPEGSAVYVDGSTKEVRTLDAAGRDRDTGKQFEGLFPTASIAVGTDGIAWLWVHAARGVEIVRVDTGRATTKSFPFPVAYAGNGTGPVSSISRPIPPGPNEALWADPAIQGLLIDERGDLWVVSAHGSSRSETGASYGPLTRLTVD